MRQSRSGPTSYQRQITYCSDELNEAENKISVTDLCFSSDYCFSSDDPIEPLDCASNEEGKVKELEEDENIRPSLKVLQEMCATLDKIGSSHANTQGLNVVTLQSKLVYWWHGTRRHYGRLLGYWWPGTRQKYLAYWYLGTGKKEKSRHLSVSVLVPRYWEENIFSTLVYWCLGISQKPRHPQLLYWSFRLIQVTPLGGRGSIRPFPAVEMAGCATGKTYVIAINRVDSLRVFDGCLAVDGTGMRGWGELNGQRECVYRRVNAESTPRAKG
ncbi:hypothetical protein PENSPDRAFT_671924 [Peniophora sp. CONT]|nr:hypothetical protein PENSPDRAFT_671924 [Peniophora sp. CONT]